MRTDAELFQDCLRTGNRAALDNLFARHYPAVYHVVLRLVRNPADASDLTQAAFLKALEAARDRRPPEALRPWLLAIAVNAVRQWKRGDRRRNREDWLFEACRKELPERRPDLDAERREFERALEEALDGFPEELAEPLVLHYYENLSYADVAGILNLSKTTVQFRMQRALEKLRERFKSRGLHALSALLPELFPSHRSPRLLSLGLAAMNLKKIAAALLIALGLLAVGRRVLLPSTASIASRSEADSSKVAGTTPRKTPEGARDPAALPGLFGTVFDQRSLAPVPGALISAYDLETATKLDTLSDDRGAWRLPCPDQRGTWHLKISRDGYASSSLRAVRCSSEPKNAFLSRGGTIKGRVIDADGLSAGAARVLAIRRQYGPGDDFDLTQVLYQQVLPREGIVEESTSARASDGTFELPHLPPGSYVLSVLAPNTAPFLFPDDLSWKGERWGLDLAEDATRDVVIALPPRGTIRFHVTDRSSHLPIPAAVVTGIVTIDRTRLPLGEFSFKTDAAGEAALPAPLDDRGTLGYVQYRVTCDGYGTQQSGLSGQDNGYVVEIRLGKTARIEGHVQGPDGKPVEGCAVYVVGDTDGGVVAQAFTNAEGFYRTRELNAPQNFEVHVYDPGLRRPRTLSAILLREGETRRLDFGTKTQAGISGSVRRKGKPCGQTLICVDALEGDRNRTVFYADEQGSFAIEGLAPGPYELFVNAGTEATGALMFTRHLTLAEGDRQEFHFDVGARSIRGTVCDAATLTPLDRKESPMIVARAAGRPDPVVSTDVRPDGTFELLVDDAGLYQVDISDNDWKYYTSDQLTADLSREAVVENLRLLVHRDTQDRKVCLRLKDQDSGAPVTEGSFQYRFRGGSGAGSILGDVIEEKTARIGPWKYKVMADEYLPVLLSFELGAQDREVERTLELRKSDAVKVTLVKPSSPAERAGLQPGDLLLSCNGSRVRNLKTLATICKSLPITQSVTLSVRRGSSTLDVVVSEPQLGIEGENGLQE